MNTKILLPKDFYTMLSRIEDTSHPRNNSWNPNAFRRELLLAYLNNPKYREWIAFLKKIGVSFAIDGAGLPLLKVRTDMSQRKLIALILDEALGKVYFAKMYSDELFPKRRSYSVPRSLLRWDVKRLAEELSACHSSLSDEEKREFPRVMPLMVWLQSDFFSTYANDSPYDFSMHKADRGCGYDNAETIINFEEEPGLYIIGGLSIPSVYTIRRIDDHEIESALEEFINIESGGTGALSIINYRFVDPKDKNLFGYYDETAFVYHLREKYPYAKIEFVEQLLPVLDMNNPFDIIDTDFGYSYQTDLPKKYLSCRCIDIGVSHIYSVGEYFKR
jgi:hypothetical protein